MFEASRQSGSPSLQPVTLFLRCRATKAPLLPLSVGLLAAQSARDSAGQVSLKISILRSNNLVYCRCAAHFGSPRVQDDNMFIYRLLIQAEVYEIDDIVKNLVHTQYFETVTVEVSRRKLHIAEDSEVLKIYVPQGRKDQELCFLQLLPTK